MECLPVDFTQFFTDIQQQAQPQQIIEELIPEDEQMASPELFAEPPDMFGDGSTSDNNNIDNDNEFVLSIMQEYERNQREGGEQHNQSVIYKPLPPPSITLLQGGVVDEETIKSETENVVNTMQGRSCQTSFDIYLNKTMSTEHLIDSDAPLSTIPSDRSDEQKLTTKKQSTLATSELQQKHLYATGDNEINRLLLESRRASSSTDSSITPRSTGITPISIDYMQGLTPRSYQQQQQQQQQQQMDSNTSFMSRSATSSVSKILRSQSSSSTTKRSKQVYTPHSTTTGTKYSSMSRDSLKSSSRNDNDTDLKDILNIVDIKQMLDVNNIDHPTILPKDDSCLEFTQQRQHHAEDDREMVMNLRNSRLSFQSTCCNDTNIEANDVGGSGRFLSELLLESKKIKSLAEEIFSNAGYVSASTKGLNQSRDGMYKSYTAAASSRIERIAVKEDLIQPKLSKDTTTTTCNCKCDICQSHQSTPTTKNNTISHSKRQKTTCKNQQKSIPRKLPPDPHGRPHGAAPCNLSEPNDGLTLPTKFAIHGSLSFIEDGDGEDYPSMLELPDPENDRKTECLQNHQDSLISRDDLFLNNNTRNEKLSQYQKDAKIRKTRSVDNMRDCTLYNKKCDTKTCCDYSAFGQGEKDYVEHLIRSEEQFEHGCPSQKPGNQQIIYCCTRGDPSLTIKTSEKMKLPEPPQQVKLQQPRLDEPRDDCHADNGNKNDNLTRDNSFVSNRRYQRNINRELEFFRERCDELARKLKVGTF